MSRCDQSAETGVIASSAAAPVASDAASPGVWLQRSTREVPKAERFDFWRQLPAGAHMERPLGTRRDFFGEFKFTATPDGIAFGAFVIDPCVSRFGPDGDDSIVDIGVLNAGTMDIRYGRDQTRVLQAGAGPVLFDPARPLTTWTTHSDIMYLRLPRAATVAALGGAAIPRGTAVRPLATGALATQLADCLRGLRWGPAGSASSVVETLHTARALALVALANVRGGGHHWEGELDAALYRVACHQLALHVGDSWVTVDAVAATLGCSRAQLYRLFDLRGESVAGRLRELRMQAAAELLQAWPRVAIGSVAVRCGYSEPIAFDKAFRRRFGMTPSDWRATQADSGRSAP